MPAISFIHKDFTKTKENYFKAIHYWVERVNNLLDSPDDYEKWLDDTGPSQEILLSGNPIYSLIRKDGRRALRIMENEPRSKKPYMAAWLEEYYLPDDSDRKVPVLTIGLELSNFTEVKCLNLIHMWFHNIPLSQMKLAIKTINEKYEKNYEKSELEKKIELYYELHELQLQPIDKNKFSNRSHWGIKEINYCKNIFNINKLVHTQFIIDTSSTDDDYIKRISAEINELRDFINVSVSTFKISNRSVGLSNKIKHAVFTKYKNWDIAYKTYSNINEAIHKSSEILKKELEIDK